MKNISQKNFKKSFVNAFLKESVCVCVCVSLIIFIFMVTTWRLSRRR